MIEPKVAPWKRDRVGELAALLTSDGVLGIVDIGGVPAKNMLSMRDDLRSSLSITMAKKTLMRLAWEQTGRSMEELESLLEGAVQPAIVHTDSMNAFQLYSELEKTNRAVLPKKARSLQWILLSRKDLLNSAQVQLLESLTRLEFLQK